MFSSLASFIFGSNTSATTNSEANQNPIRQQEQLEEERRQQRRQKRIEAENTIEVTSSTPSVTGSKSNNNNNNKFGKRGKNKRGKQARNKQAAQQQQQQKPTLSITKLLTPSESVDDDEDFNVDDWFIVEREDEDDSLPRSDSEEEQSVVEIKPKAAVTAAAAITSADSGATGTQRRLLPSLQTHSLYNGPRPQQHRNYSKRTARKSGVRNVGAVKLLTLSPPRCIATNGALDGVVTAEADVGAGVTQSLYVASAAAHYDDGAHNNSAVIEFGANVLMDESWLVTPPPCFTSIGPINIGTSPFENLLIEHPSMSVYHSIRTAQEAVECFVNLDLGAEESQNQERAVVSATQTPKRRSSRAVQQRPNSVRLECYNAAELKQEMLVRAAQKNHVKKERQIMARSATKRANKAREYQSKNNRPRRSDMQHSKVLSGANNNRKSHF